MTICIFSIRAQKEIQKDTQVHWRRSESIEPSIFVSGGGGGCNGSKLIDQVRERGREVCFRKSSESNFYLFALFVVEMLIFILNLSS